MQRKEEIKPLFLNLDTDFSELKLYQSPFIKGLTFDINANPVDGIGTNNPSGEGQNALIQTPTRSNVEVPNVLLPDGYNKHIGCYESTTTHELYELKFNSNGNHGVYVLSGDTGVWQKVIVDPELQFTDDQENFIANHRVSIRFVLDANKNIIEKYLLITDGHSWQKYINVIAAIRSNGFDAVQYPYWKLQPPHFDRKELLEWPVRPPMTKPVVTPVANTAADRGKLNRFIDKGFQVAFLRQNTDGRTSKLSPYSLPILIKSEDFLNSPDNIPKNVKVTMDAGSPLTEKNLIYVRQAKKGTNTLQSIDNWGDWFLYDTIKKFPNSNSADVLSTEYWLRTNPWAAYNYNPVLNTIEYIFDLSKVQQIALDQESINEIQTNMPQLNVAMTDLGDAALLCNNRYGYPNFGDDIMSKTSVEVGEKANSSCVAPLRNIRLYAYIGRPGIASGFSAYTSQVGYFNGEDTQMRFGGLDIGAGENADVDIDESKFFELDFADKNAFRCYLKGTPYYSDGTWYQVNSDNSLVKLPQLLDISKEDVLKSIQDVFEAQGYFVCVFDINAPADKYIATLGRHNVASDGDYRNKSTYIYGIANSRIKSQVNTINFKEITCINPSAINNGNGILYSKEMEVDCTSGDVDVWGNNHDLFYVFCPNNAPGYRFIEGYFKETAVTGGGSSIPVEMFPYRLNTGAKRDWGQFTDKNGFYWAYSLIFFGANKDIEFVCKLDCAYPNTFSIPTSQSGAGWKINEDNYLSDHTGTGEVGVNNRIYLFGKISSLDGSLSYSNIAISIKDGATVYTRSDGTFILIVHNGMNGLRVSNIYVNAGSNFFITLENCGQIPLFNFNEALAPCIPSPIPTGVVRSYPIRLDLAIQISTDSQTSVKEGGKYNVGIYGADLAGRVMYVNVISEVPIPSFLQRDNLAATFLRLLLAVNIDFSNYIDMKWLFICVSKNVSIKRFIQWIGDEIDYIDNNGQKVADPASAVFVSIKINSLYNSNLAKNFSLLSTYQFVKEDRLRIYDDGEGNLFDVATYGDPIDLQILGTNYIQAAIDSGLLPPQSNTVLSTPVTTPDVTLIVKYDSRLDKLIQKKGFWIEIYTPTEQSDVIPFYEVASFPIINGRPAIFTGYDLNGNPLYTYPTSVDLDFWDTYFFDRNITIPDVGSRFFAHPFESENVTDNWGADVISGGRNNIKNDNARQYWLPAESIKSDNFLKEGLINGLAEFRTGNKKDFGAFPYGGIIAVHAERNVIAFVCENDWFITDYNYHYAFANEQGVMVTNLDNGLSTPHQKIGGQFGLHIKDTGTFIPYEKEIYWFDRRNEACVRMNYRDAVDTTVKSESEQGGIHSYVMQKSNFVTRWNSTHDKENSFDIIAGIDLDLAKIYLTFRCRRSNSNEVSSYINDRRNWQLNFQETLVYDTESKGWLRSEGFTPEGYGSLRGNETGTELIAYASGKPYYHNSAKNSFNEFFGVQTTPVRMGVFNNDNSEQKEFDGIIYGGNPSGFYIDLMYTNFENSFSYLSVNKFQQFFRNYYGAIQTNMCSYPSNLPEDLFRCMLNDGYRMVGKYLVFRMVGAYQYLNKYKQLGTVSALIKQDQSNKKVVTEK